MDTDALERGLRTIRYAARIALSSYPSLFLPYARYRYRADDESRVVGPGTDIVIEGFQRSGNTFAVVAFRSAQPRPVRVAHHLHAAAQIKQGVRLGIPVLLLIRDPDDCAVSHLIRNPHVGPRSIFESWVRFHRQLHALRSRVVTAPFEEVTTNLGAVIDRVNERYGASFARFEHTPENVEAVFRSIERGHARLHGAANGAVVETRVARPSPRRAELEREVRQRLEAPALASLRERAGREYRSWVPPTQPS